MRFLVCFVALVGALVAGTFASSGPAAADASCGHGGYSYAGFQALSPARGVRATIVALGPPQVEKGHVAAWVGVGGPGQGASGADAWIQVGLSTFEGTDSTLYFETNRPGIGPRYTLVRSGIAAGSAHRVAVLEVRGRRGWWRVWVDGAPVSEPVYLARGSGRWRPIATAETWDGGRRVCNLFSYRFGRVSLAGRGGGWRSFRSGYRFQDPGYRVLESSGGFVARAVRPLPVPTALTKAPAERTAEQGTPPGDSTAPPEPTTATTDEPNG
jgi:hypothetical protein